MNRFLLTIFLSCTLFSLMAQNPFPGRGTAFQDEIVPRVDITIAPADLDEILAPGNEYSDEEFPATFMFTDAEETDTVFQAGFRLRGNTSRLSAKKSFKVSFNTFVDDKWKGLEKINLNGEHNDPTVSRSKLCSDLLREMQIPAMRANHVALYINGEYRGLYANVEQIDEEYMDRRYGNKDGNLYKCRFPADLDYLGDDPEAYKLTDNSYRVYELQNNEEEDDYSDFADFVRVINQTPLADLPCELEAIFNVDTYLRTMAFDVLTGNWDGYAFNQNNFYLYHNTATDRFEYIPFDLDNTLGIDWLGRDWTERHVYNWPSTGSDRPLFKRLIQVPDYRARFTYYLETFMADFFNPLYLFPRFDALQEKLEPFVADDPFYPLDYGYDLEDYENAFSTGNDYFHTDYALKPFVLARRENALEQMESLNPAPYLSGARRAEVSVGQVPAFQVQIQEDEEIEQVELCYQVTGEDYTCVSMSDAGTTGDGIADDGEYGVFLDALSAATQIDYYFTATDNEGATNRLPACGNFTMSVTSGGLQLAINELMASNGTVIADEFDEFDDWVEIHNYGDTDVPLGGRYLSDNPDNPTKWAFPDITIAAGEFLLVWVDNDEEQGPLHTDFKLDADGEYIGIYDTDASGNMLIDGTEFGPQETDTALGRLPNGTGAFQAVNPTPAASNEPLRTGEGFVIKNFTVYPNPTPGGLTIDAPEAGNYHAKLYDITGRIISTVNWQGIRREWRIEFPSGMYVLTIEENSTIVYSKKIVRQ